MMKRSQGLFKTTSDDEWYTPHSIAAKVAGFLHSHLPEDTPILCPADILPDGSESSIPNALKSVGFRFIRVTRDLLGAWEDGEVIVTNPPFSLLVPFRRLLEIKKMRYCILTRPGSMARSWPINSLGEKFFSADGRSVAASWQQNIVNTQVIDESIQPIGDCSLCERKACPKNSLTGGLKPGESRPLYGVANAVKLGISGFYCRGYTVNGRNTFTRYFYPQKGDLLGGQ